MRTSFSKKVLEIHITLGNGTFARGNKKKIIRGLASEVTIKEAVIKADKKTVTNGILESQVTAKIFGMSLADMAQIVTSLNKTPKEPYKNVIEIMAGGEEDEQLIMIFEGDIQGATLSLGGGSSAVDISDSTEAGTKGGGTAAAGGAAAGGGTANSSNDAAITLHAKYALNAQKTGSFPTSFPGIVPVSNILEQLAARMGLVLKNEGVESSLVDAVFNGSLLKQALDAVRQAGIDFLIEKGLMIILPPGGARSGDTLLINKDTGLIGYPTLTNNAVKFNCFYHPGICTAKKVKVESIIPNASGEWVIDSLTHKLTSHLEKGSWQTEVSATKPTNTEEGNDDNGNRHRNR